MAGGGALNSFGTRQTDGRTAPDQCDNKTRAQRIKSTPRVITFNLLVNLFPFADPVVIRGHHLAAHRVRRPGPRFRW